MKYIKNYEGLFDIFKRKPKDSKRAEVDKICKLLKLEKYTINDDYTVDVDGSVDISYRKIDDGSGQYHRALLMKEIPIKFGNVSGNFFCNHNELYNLKNAPDWVGGRFDCRAQYYSSLRSLEGAPKYVGYDFDCSDNERLRSLKFSPDRAKLLNFTHTLVPTLDDISKNVSDIDCNHTPINTLYDLVYFKDLQTTVELLSAYDPIDADNPKKPALYRDRLELLCDYISELDKSPRHIYEYDIKNIKKFYDVK